jgi:hypothetical protein
LAYVALTRALARSETFANLQPGKLQFYDQAKLTELQRLFFERKVLLEAQAPQVSLILAKQPGKGQLAVNNLQRTLNARRHRFVNRFQCRDLERAVELIKSRFAVLLDVAVTPPNGSEDIARTIELNQRLLAGSVGWCFVLPLPTPRFVSFNPWKESAGKGEQMPFKQLDHKI